MPSVDDRYAPNQRSQAFVDHETGTLIALAGPGTGKTYSLILRIQELVQNRNVPASDICYLTFIREIAIAFRSDLQGNYENPAEIESLRINTLHSLALRIIRNTGFRIGLDGHLHIMNFADESDPMSAFVQTDLTSLLSGSDDIHSRSNLRTSMYALKCEWEHNRNPNNLTGDNALLFDAYSRYSRAFRTLDWDELIPLATSIYVEETNRPAWLNSLKHFLIDEYQDFNPAEQNFLSLLCGKSSSSVIVGDPDQSIYSGRGASPTGIQTKANDVNNSSVSLVICRRCRARLVEAANGFLALMNPDPRLLVPLKTEGIISVKSFPSCKAEADYLAERLSAILAGVQPDTRPEERPICLFPSRKVLGQYKKEFEKRGIRCDARDVLDILDEKAWLRICARLAIQRDQPFLERILLERFTSLRRRIHEIVDLIIKGTPSVISALDMLAQQSGWGAQSEAGAQEYKTFLNRLTSGDPDLVLAVFNSLLSNNRCTREMIESFLNAADEINLDDFIDNLVSQVFPDTSQRHADESFQATVELLTMHGSKGLTRRWVFIPGFEQAWMPGNAVGRRLEELKRVFFVALTRATDEVSITYPRTRARGDALNFNINGRGQRSTFTHHLHVTQDYLVCRR